MNSAGLILLLPSGQRRFNKLGDRLLAPRCFDKLGGRGLSSVEALRGWNSKAAGIAHTLVIIPQGLAGRCLS